ncbi:Cysteine-rich secretory protein family protein [Pseudoduganella lurida]|uniref:Cysteine-rich secretory protein family protein n=1 Tax=Pseudoduganella lurida TaxID=1036180 RepID=A0A562RAH2_9BURK|nr:CAP domain-containing protein [Pseudoduganella lurida]TWI65386.1 Cysteine-rich secretory protein family protein [Pseudoduganella lurida]
MRSHLRNVLPLAAVFVATCAAPAAHASQSPRELVSLINAYRAAPGTCAGRPAAPVAPLDAAPALSGIRIGAGMFLEPALEQAGYPADHAEAMSITNVSDASDAMRTLREHYCTQLLSTDVSAIGAVRSAAGWDIVLARPHPERRLPAPGDVADEVLAAVNAARAQPRNCGSRHFAAAPPLRLSRQLDAAAVNHSTDMAELRYFSHQAKDGSVVGDRAIQAGYRWRAIGENIASGQESARAAVDGWLDSPGHCENIMNAAFTEMGIGYAVNPERGRVYWTQVLASAR